jgi:hypothetical protein
MNSLLFVFFLVSGFNFTFSVSSEQSPTITDGLTQGTETLEAHERDKDFRSESITKELVQQFIKILSSTDHKSSSSMLAQYLIASLKSIHSRTRLLFSLSLNRSFVRIMCCGGSLVTGSLVSAYSALIFSASVEQKRIVAESGAWPILIALLPHESAEVVKFACMAMRHLLHDRDGEDYGVFIENGLFDELVKLFPRPPEPVTVDIHFAPETECHSEGFAAVGCTWFPSHSPSYFVTPVADYPLLIGFYSRDLEMLTVRSTKPSFSV